MSEVPLHQAVLGFKRVVPIQREEMEVWGYNPLYLLIVDVTV